MKIMAIDYGDAHTGIAVSDALLTLAGFTTVITAYRPEAVAAEIQRLIAEHGVTELVLGHPLNMDGTRGPRAEKAEGFAALLRETTGLPVTLWDERRTTVDAHNILMAGGKNAKQRKKTVDGLILFYPVASLQARFIFSIVFFSCYLSVIPITF